MRLNLIILIAINILTQNFSMYGHAIFKEDAQIFIELGIYQSYQNSTTLSAHFHYIVPLKIIG